MAIPRTVHVITLLISHKVQPLLLHLHPGNAKLLQVIMNGGKLVTHRLPLQHPLDHHAQGYLIRQIEKTHVHSKLDIIAGHCTIGAQVQNFHEHIGPQLIPSQSAISEEEQALQNMSL